MEAFKRCPKCRRYVTDTTPVVGMLGHVRSRNGDHVFATCQGIYRVARGREGRAVFPGDVLAFPGQHFTGVTITGWRLGQPIMAGVA